MPVNSLQIQVPLLFGAGIFYTERKLYFKLRNCTMNCMQEASSHTISDSQFHSEQAATNGIIHPSEQGFV